MSYSNEFLRNFRPVFLAILKAQSFRPERVELVVIDEERSHVFEPADVRDVLEQIGDDLNYLTGQKRFSHPRLSFPRRQSGFWKNHHHQPVLLIHSLCKAFDRSAWSLW